MAGELIHADVGGELTEAEYHSLLAHLLADQQRGDLIMSNAAASGLVRLPKGSQGQSLVMGADDPEWGGGGYTMHAVPAAIALSAGDFQLFASMFKDTNGVPDRCVVVTPRSTTAVAVIEYKRLGNAWVFDPADCAYDTSVTLNFTTANQDELTAFAIDSPVASGNRILFIAGNNNAAPDTFEMDSIVLTAGGSSLTATAVVIAGANQPTDTNFIATCNVPLSTTRVMTFFQDDAHFADLTESGGTYTFTYSDAKVLAVDTSISISSSNARAYSGLLIGSQVLLLRAGGGAGASLTTDQAWEMSITATLTEEFNPFRAGMMGTFQTPQNRAAPALTAIGGVFAIAAPVGGSGADGAYSGYLISTFPLDDI